MTSSKKPLVIIPTLNEVNTISALIRKILELHADCHVLVVDGGSTDGTDNAVREIGQQNPQVQIVIQSPDDCGFGQALVLGFRRY